MNKSHDKPYTAANLKLANLEYLIQNGQFIARPGSEYMKEYHKEQHTMLDNHYPYLTGVKN